MRILVLGGTAFLGRHFVEAALSHRHDVTLFTRGRRSVPWSAVNHLVGDRDPTHSPGLDALTEGTWDMVVDTSGYLPRCVRAGAELLHGRVGRYLYVSSISVYADPTTPGIDESGPLEELADPASEEINRDYGALKAACEREVQAVFGAQALIVRPGLIVGPHDPSDRFGYWVARFAAPELLGDRPAEAVVPTPPDRPIQVIDARDLAQWMLALVEDGTSGVFNACSPAGQWSMRDVIATARAAGEERVAPRWIDDTRLVAQDVTPWIGLPLWIPTTDPESAAFMSFDGSRAARAGLKLRALENTVRDTAEWLRARGADGAFGSVLSDVQERAILEADDDRPNWIS
jgi:2'-hydroxyisoflavone reductase